MANIKHFYKKGKTNYKKVLIFIMGVEKQFL